jgi:hypothetical protein
MARRSLIEAWMNVSFSGLAEPGRLRRQGPLSLEARSRRQRPGTPGNALGAEMQWHGSYPVGKPNHIQSPNPPNAGDATWVIIHRGDRNDGIFTQRSDDKWIDRLGKPEFTQPSPDRPDRGDGKSSPIALEIASHRLSGNPAVMLTGGIKLDSSGAIFPPALGFPANACL